MKHLFILFSIVFFSKFAFSQIEEIQVEEEKFVVIYKDSRLDELDKRPALIAKAELDERAAKLKAAKAEDNSPTLYKPIVSADGTRRVTGSITTAKGFRVIIYNGAERAKAMEVKNSFARMFPDTRSYMSYNVPSYKIKVGDFENRKDATNFLKRVSKTYPASFIVPDIVTVKNINVSR
jgi:hypothetical protein